MPGPVDAQQIGAMAGMGSGSFKSSDPRAMYEQWQKVLAELEQLKGVGPPQTIAPEYRVNPNTNTREYNIGGRWASEKTYQDPGFQATVVEPWLEQERMRKAEEYNKQIAEAQQRAAMHEYDYNDYLRRQEEIKRGGGGAGTLGSTARSPRPGGGGGGMGSTTRR